MQRANVAADRRLRRAGQLDQLRHGDDRPLGDFADDYAVAFNLVHGNSRSEITNLCGCCQSKTIIFDSIAAQPFIIAVQYAC